MDESLYHLTRLHTTSKTNKIGTFDMKNNNLSTLGRYNPRSVTEDCPGTGDVRIVFSGESPMSCIWVMASISYAKDAADTEPFGTWGE